MEFSQLAQTLCEKFPGAEEKKGTIVLPKKFLLPAAHFLKTECFFDNLHCVTAVDWKDKMEVIYHLYSFQKKMMLTIKIFLERCDLEIATLSDLWKSANWLEREVYDLFGIKFSGHPDLRRILNPETWTDFPLRKDFQRADCVPLPQTEGLKGSG